MYFEIANCGNCADDSGWHSDVGGAARKNAGEAGDCSCGGRGGETGRGGDGAAEILCRRMDYTETCPKSAFSQNGGKNTGLYTSKLGPGGNSLMNAFHSQGPVGDFEGLMVMTWDAREKAYKAYAIGE
jgi:hypothetical protein